VWILIFFALCITAVKTSHDIHSLNDIERIGDTIENRIDAIEDATEDAIEKRVESIVNGVVDNGTSEIITAPDGATVDIMNTEQSGVSFRKTTINIDK
jgi:hypothetical protein